MFPKEPMRHAGAGIPAKGTAPKRNQTALPGGELSGSPSGTPLFRLQRTVKAVGDRALEEGGGVAVEGLQASCGEAGVHLAAHEEVHVQDKLDLRIGLGVGGIALDHTGPGMDLGAAGAVQAHLHVHRALAGALFVHVLGGEDPQVGGGDELPPGLPLQPQGLAGEDVHIAQADALEKGGLVDADELGQGQVEVLAEGLPAGVGYSGQGDEIAGQVQLPPAVGGDEVVVDDAFGLFQPGLGGPQVREAGGGGLLLGGVSGEHAPHGLLEFRGFVGGDGEDSGETELTDHLRKLGPLVADPGMVRVQHGPDLLFVSLIVAPMGRKVKAGVAGGREINFAKQPSGRMKLRHAIPKGCRPCSRRLPRTGKERAH